MNCPAPLTCLLGLIVLTQCTTSHDPRAATAVTVEQLQKAYTEPDLKFSRTRVKCSIVQNGKTTRLPDLVLAKGHTAKAEAFSTTKVPTKFKFPSEPSSKRQDPGGSSSFPVTPAVPESFTDQRTGWSVALTAHARGSFLMLTGTLTEESLGHPIQAGGQPFEQIVTSSQDILGRSVPLVITNNAATQPTRVSKTAPLYVAATPGQICRVYLDEARTTYAELNCELLQ